MWKLITLFGTVIVVIHGQSTPVQSCVSNAGVLPINTHIRGCGLPPCLLPQLEDVVIDIVFRAPKPINNMTTLATAYMNLAGMLIPIPYDLQKDSVTCDFLTNTNCPVKEGEIIQYTLKMYVEPFFPVGTALAIEFAVVDASDRSPVFCIRTNIRIVAPLGKAAANPISVN
ncbi:uncharacterized protein ACR2FA_001843 [Aphomia sociella]